MNFCRVCSLPLQSYFFYFDYQRNIKKKDKSRGNNLAISDKSRGNNSMISDKSRGNKPQSPHSLEWELCG